VTRLSRMQLAQLRGSRIGFVFQSFNLLPRATALDNVRMPAAYAADSRPLRRVVQRSRELLAMVGLESRLDHTPSRLSGGEQQRVAISRALINQPRMLLADEPTGNLDSRTGKEILELFRRLNTEQGISVLLVTHDAEVARYADRVVRLVDGRIVGDVRTGEAAQTGPATAAESRTAARPLRRARNDLRVAAGAVRIALQALRRNVMRTLLTMLGVIIGVAAVITMMEMSQGASEAIQVTVTNMGANTLIVSPGTSQGAAGFGERVDTLTPEDVTAIERECPAVVCTAPIVTARGQIVYGNRSWTPNYMTGSTAAYLRIRNWTELDLGRPFTDREVLSGSKVCVLGKTVVRELFGDRHPIGEEIRVKNVPFTVIGVLSEKGANLLGTDQDDILFAPWTTVQYRLSGAAGGTVSVRLRGSGHSPPGPSLAERLPGTRPWIRTESIRQIMVKARSTEAIPAATAQITHLLRDRHRLEESRADFNIYDMAEVSNALKRTIRMLSGLIVSIAAVSLIVGGVGIMNIMLVSVTERTREIGLRMAVGADARDILRQFLVEAVVLCLLGGFIGILVGRGGSIFVGAMMGWPTQTSPGAAAIAVLVSVTVGITFGFYPAWKASRLNPIDALRYE